MTGLRRRIAAIGGADRAAQQPCPVPLRRRDGDEPDAGVVALQRDGHFEPGTILQRRLAQVTEENHASPVARPRHDNQEQ